MSVESRERTRSLFRPGTGRELERDAGGELERDLWILRERRDRGRRIHSMQAGPPLDALQSEVGL